MKTIFFPYSIQTDCSFFPYRVQTHSSKFGDQERQILQNVSERKESYRLVDELYQRNFLEEIASSLISANQLAAYVITGAAHGYTFQDAVVQVTQKQIHIYRWHEVEKYVKTRLIKGTIDWQKVVTAVKQNGQTPEDKPSKQSPKYKSGRFITTYAVSGSNRAWARIHSGGKHLSVHRLHELMVVLMER